MYFITSGVLIASLKFFYSTQFPVLLQKWLVISIMFVKNCLLIALIKTNKTYYCTSVRENIMAIENICQLPFFSCID